MFFCFNCFKANTMYQSISSLFVGGHVHIGQTEGNIESWCLVLRWQVSTRSGDAQCCTIKWDTKQIQQQQQQIKQLGGREWHGSGTTKIYRILGFLHCLNGARMPGSSLLHWKTLTACFAVSLFTFGCYVRCGIRGEMRTQRHVLDCAPVSLLAVLICPRQPTPLSYCGGCGGEDADFKQRINLSRQGNEVEGDEDSPDCQQLLVWPTDFDQFFLHVQTRKSDTSNHSRRSPWRSIAATLMQEHQGSPQHHHGQILMALNPLADAWQKKVASFLLYFPWMPSIFLGSEFMFGNAWNQQL